MNIVFDALQVYLSAKRKQISGWLASPRSCCEHNGTTPDTRQRGGLIANADEGVSSFTNCGFKTSWRNGRNPSLKMKKFMRWLNVPDDTITKLALQVHKRKLIAQVTKHLIPPQICIPRVTHAKSQVHT